MLTRLRVKNFKLLRDVELELEAEQPTVLIGTNAAGKSTVLEVLDFLYRCADGGVEAAVVAHGGVGAIRTIGHHAPIEIVTEWAVTGHDHPDGRLVWSLALDATDHGHVALRAEQLLLGSRVLVETTPDGRRLVFDEAMADRPPSAVGDVRKLAFHSFADPKSHFWLGALEGFCAGLRTYGALSVAPAWSRAAPDYPSARTPVVLSTSTTVGREGLGLATALYNLQLNAPTTWTRLEQAFRAEFPFVQRLVFPPDPGGGRVAFAIDDARFPGRRIFASEMSDGMIEMLCLLAVLADGFGITVLGLDEPDAHMHPSAVRRILSFERPPGSLRRLMVVTHSDAVVDQLADPAASLRVVESTPQGARIRKLDPDALAAWRKDYSLSDLRRTGLLGPSNSDYETRE